MEKNRKVEAYIQDIILQSGNLKNPGLCHGYMGIVIMLAVCGKKMKNPFYKDLAEELLDKLFDLCDLETPIGFENGLCGIGWGLEYLVQHQLMDCEADFLEEVDEAVMTKDVRRIKDYSLETGLSGIITYVMARQQGKLFSRIHSFPGIYLKELYQAANRMLKDTDIPNIQRRTALKYIDHFITGDLPEDPISFDDFCDLPPCKNNSETPLFDLPQGRSGMILHLLTI